MKVKKKILKFVSLWLPPILLALFIFKLSNGTVPKASTDFWIDFGAKKLAHITVYGTLTLLIYRALRGEGMERKKAIIWSLILATGYGVTDEFHQSFTQGREARIRDVGFDFLGSSVVSYVVYKVLPKYPKWEEKFL